MQSSSLTTAENLPISDFPNKTLICNQINVYKDDNENDQVPIPPKAKRGWPKKVSNQDKENIRLYCICKKNLSSSKLIFF